MKMLACAALMLSTFLLCAPPAEAQRRPGHTAGENGIGSATACSYNDSDGTLVLCSPATPLPMSGKQEAYQLASANAAAAPVTVYGGDYVLAQTCSGYNSGSLVLQVLGPDQSTYQSILSKSGSDTTGGTGVALGSGAIVKASLPAGSAGCYASLTRVP